jgi:hypothetical protein
VKRSKTEPVFVNLLRSPGIDFPAWRNPFLGSINVYKDGLCLLIFSGALYSSFHIHGLQIVVSFNLKFWTTYTVSLPLVQYCNCFRGHPMTLRGIVFFILFSGQSPVLCTVPPCTPHGLRSMLSTVQTFLG